MSADGFPFSKVSSRLNSPILIGNEKFLERKPPVSFPPRTVNFDASKVIDISPQVFDTVAANCHAAVDVNSETALQTPINSDSALTTLLREKAIASLSVDTMLQMVRLPLCITDPSQLDNPIVYVNDAFVAMTGYTLAECVGRNCRFLQGPETTPASIEQVRATIALSAVRTVEIVNYRKDGSKFINALQIGPVSDEEGNALLFFGSQMDITAQRLAEEAAQHQATQEMLHRLRNIVSVMAVLIRTTAEEIEDRRSFIDTVIGRLTALSAGHFAFFTKRSDEAIRLKALCDAVVHAYAPRGEHQLVFTGENASIGSDLVTTLALVLHELAANSVKYGALSSGEGTVTLTGAEDASRITLEWRERGGPQVAHSGRSSGSAIVANLLRRVGGGMEYDFRREGLTAALHVPRR